MWGKIKIVFFQVCCLVAPYWVQGQAPLKALRLKVDNGLPSDLVYQTTADESGNLYVATNRGLCLYDGYRFIKNPYVNGAVWSLFRRDASLYFYAPDVGLCSINHIFDSVKIISAVKFTDSIPENDHYEHVYADKEYRIWCTDFHNIKYFDLKNGTSASYVWDSDNTDIKKPMTLWEPVAGSLWAFSPKGLWVWNKRLRQFHLHPNPRLNKLSYTAAFFSQQAIFYLATTSGDLLSFDLHTDSVHMLPALPGGEKPLYIRQIEANSQSYILFCTEHKVYALDVRKQTYALWYQTEKAEIKGLTVNDVLHIIWLSTNSGLYKLTLYPDALQLLALPDETDKPVTTIARDDSGNIWSATASRKIWKYAVSGRWESFSLPGEEDTRCNSLSISGSVVLATASDGLYQFQDGQFIKRTLGGMASSEPVKKALLDRNHHLWTIGVGRSVNVFDWPGLRYKKDFIRNPESFWRKNVLNDIIQNTDGKIWFAAWMPKDFGIVFYDTATKKLAPISPQNNQDMFMGDYYRNVARSSGGALLFSGFGGWNLVNADGAIKKLLNTSQYDVMSNHVEGISADDSGNIWFATAEGLYKYDFKKDKALRFSQTDGLPTDDLTNGYCPLPGGKLALGVSGGLLIVDQHEILRSPLINKLVITAIKIKGVLQPPKTHIKLFDEQTDLTLYFSALTFSEDEKIVYRYRFAEDKSWVNLGHVPELHLARLNYGHYNIIFQAGDHLQNWQDEQLEITLDVPAPFYKTLWFSLLVFTFIVLLMFLGNRYLLRQHKIKEQLKRRLKDAEMQALRSQMNPHFLFNTLNSINSYIIQNKTENASDYLTMFSRLMRNILNNSQQPLISLKKELEALRLYMELEGMRLDYSFDYTIHIDKDIDSEEVNIPPLILQPFIENAIWHGLRTKGKEGILELDVRKISESRLKICITDNGIGRAAASGIKTSQTSHQSFGMDITSNRLQLLNADNTIAVIDLFDKDKRAAGTQIVILLNF